MTVLGVVDGVVLRRARPGDGPALYDVTLRSIRALGSHHYSPAQLDGWMGTRTADYYEAMIGRNNTVVAAQDGDVIGFVDAVPGEVTRLFLAPEGAGRGLGRHLLSIGIETAARGHSGPIRVEATLNAQGFYERHGFSPVGTGFFSHGIGGDPIAVVMMEREPEPTA